MEFLGQSGALTPTQQSVRDHFQEGGSPATVAAVLLATGGIVLLAYLLTRRQARSAGRSRVSDPQGLFQDLLRRLELTNPQRQGLTRLVTDLGVAHPTVLLLYPAVFDEHSQRWLDEHDRAGRASRMDLATLGEVRAVLFERDRRSDPTPP